MRARHTRERRHIEAIALAVDGAATEALATVRTHAAEYPRDALPLSLALGVFGLLGFSGRRDHHEAQLALLEELAPHWGDDWWFLGYLGWAYIETGEVARGTRLVERSLAGNPRNAHAAHQRVHGFFESGDAAGGAEFIEDLAAGLRPRGAAALPSVVARWHYSSSLAAIASAPVRSTWTTSGPRWRKRCQCWCWPTRRRFCGAGGSTRRSPPLDDEWTEVAAHAQRHFPRASLAFADLHAALAEAATGDGEWPYNSRIAGLQSLARDGRLPPGEVAPALAAGAAALGRGDNAEAARVLEAALVELPRIGGSHAQREVFEDSLIVAYLRSGQSAKAAPLLRSRLARRPSARDKAWLALCSGNPPGA